MQDKTAIILKELYALQRFGIKPGLERTLKLLDFYGNPQNQIETIHTAGTNGKGAVCSIISSILKESGLKVGLYTSPHLVRFNERIKINGSNINDTDLVRLAEPLLEFGKSISATFFEITTVIALKYFTENNIDIAVIETGMGGRFDSTNVIKPLMSVITEIGLDHQEYLGSSIEEIAFEKAGIIKKGIPVVVSESPDVAMEVIIEKAFEMRSPVIFSKKIEIDPLEFYQNLSMQANFTLKDFRIENLLIKNAGLHQINNVKTALAVILNLNEKYKISETAIRKGFEKIRENAGYVGRIDMLIQNPLFVLDVSHNPAGIKCLMDTLRLCGRGEMQWNIIFGAMSDKDITQMLSLLSTNCKNLYPVSPNIERAASALQIEEMARSVSIKNINVLKTLEEAIVELIKKNEPILATGSFYLAGEILSILEKKI
jgi:dihydrofolate synthase / folylpolyglutamate synthase